MAIQACDSGDMSKAIDLLTQAIDVAPSRAACYNNRAQVYRLMGLADDAMDDLDKAIDLSGGQGRSACQAFCQKGTSNSRFGLAIS